MDSRSLKVFFLFLASYALLFFLGNFLSKSLGVKAWDFSNGIWRLDYMLWFTPIAGFFFIYMLIPYLRSEFGFGRHFIYSFPILYFVFSFLAYQLSVWWYYGNQLFLATNGTYAGCALFLCIDVSPFGLNYWNMFVQSQYLYFVVAGVLGWGARMLIEYFEPPAEAK